MSDRQHLYKAKRTDSEEWVEGVLFYRTVYIEILGCKDVSTFCYLMPSGIELPEKTRWEDICVEVIPSTVCQYTGLTDKKGKKIWENDITKLILPDGEVRYLKVSFKKIIREVLCHPDFYDDVARVEIHGICFEWNGYDLFPCVDENGVSDISKMEVVGNIFDNPKLLEVGTK